MNPHPSLEAGGTPAPAPELPGAPAIEVRGVAKQYGPVPALCDITFAVRRGELFGLVGPDGAGKTTLLRILAGLLRPTAGHVLLDGLDIATERTAAQAKIGYMSQRFSLSMNLTVLENLMYVAEVWRVPRGARRQRIAQLLQFSRLAPFQDRLTGHLSGGMRQKLSLAAALVHRPEILLLDEPTIGVDPISRRDFWLILYDLLQAGTTIFVSTPYMDEAERCTRVGFLLDGRLIACGTPRQLKEQLGTAVLELRCADARAAQRRLRQRGAPGEAVLFGDRLHLALPKAGLDIKAALAAVRAAGVSVEEWRLREPSLEDVFLALAPRQPAAAPSER